MTKKVIDRIPKTHITNHRLVLICGENIHFKLQLFILDSSREIHVSPIRRRRAKGYFKLQCSYNTKDNSYHDDNCCENPYLNTKRKKQREGLSVHTITLQKYCFVYQLLIISNVIMLISLIIIINLFLLFIKSIKKVISFKNTIPFHILNMKCFIHLQN